MKQKKKSSFFTFIFSFVPGMAEMYMGFMKSGASILAILLLSFIIPTIFNAHDVFILVGLGIWAFSFFHARNLAHLTFEEFTAYEDRFIWDEMTDNRPTAIAEKLGRRGIAIILIIFGCAVVWNNLKELVERFLPESFWDTIYPIIANIPGTIIAIIIILIGARMIKGKKEELLIEDNQNS